MNKNMSNKANLGQSQMFITVISTTNYNEKMKLDTWSKRTQTKPISGGSNSSDKQGILALKKVSV
jgi:hypothetical protein